MATKRKSPLSKLTKQVRHFFHDAVEAPPEPEKPQPEEELPEEPDEPIPEPDFPDPPDDPEEPAPEQDTEAIDILNQATQRWKETGDSGLHLTAPIKLSERAKTIWNKVAHDISPKLANRLKHDLAAVTSTASDKLSAIRAHSTPPTTTLPPAPAQSATPPLQQTVIAQPVKTPPTPPTVTQIDTAIKQSWKEVLTKAEEHSTPTEREEIEKIYKQLSS